jgi:hypothetical protein
MTGRRPAMTGRRPGGYRGNGRRLMPLGSVWLLGSTPPAPVAASTGGRGVEGPRCRSSRWQAVIGCGRIAVAAPPLFNFRGKRPHWRDPTKLKAPSPAMRPNTESGRPKEPQTRDQQGEANAPHPGRVGRADLPSLDPVVRDEGTLSGASREDRRLPCKVGGRRVQSQSARPRTARRKGALQSLFFSFTFTDWVLGSPPVGV